VQLRIKRLGLRDRLRAEVDADTEGRLQRRQHVPAAAAEFEHPLALRHQKPHELAVVVVIGDVEFAPAFDLIEIGFDLIEQFPFSLIFEWRRGRGLRRIHHAPEWA
jgi:hypothetical protein